MLPEIPKGKFTWIRPRSHAWVEVDLQAALVAFVRLFEAEHPWVRRGSMSVEERFADFGVNARVPFGPTGPEQEKRNFMQRDGTPFVVIGAVRERDGQTYQVSIPFPLGNDTPYEASLAAARLSLRSQEVQSR